MHLWRGLAALGVLAALGLPWSPAHAGVTARIDVNARGQEADGPSFAVSISADGRFVAYDSAAGNLVANDGNSVRDVFVFDRQAGTTELVSVPLPGATANGDSRAPAISTDGRFVAFASDASNLVAGDVDGVRDVFVRDRQLQSTVVVSVTDTGISPNGPSDSPSISGDGRSVAFASNATNLIVNTPTTFSSIFVADMVTGAVTAVSTDVNRNAANGPSLSPSISGNGRFIAFSSDATDLVPGDTNSFRDVFVFDRVTGGLLRASVSSTGAQASGASDSASLNQDGTVVAFASRAGNLVANDINGTADVFTKSLPGGLVTRESVATNGTPGDSESLTPALSLTGRFVAFASVATNLVTGDANAAQDVFVRDREVGLTVRVSVSSADAEADGDSGGPAITANGREVAFLSSAGNLVAQDTNSAQDVFVHRWISFSDMPPEQFGFREVEAAVVAGVVQGFSDDTYRPTLVVTRDQMAVFIARALAGGDQFVPPGPATPTFSDVPLDFWAFRHIEFLVSLGVVQGFPDGTYRPDLPVDRAQMAVFIARAVAGGDAKVPLGPPTASFPDVPTTFWAFKYIEFLKSIEVVQGFPDGLYHPELDVDRATMAVFIARAFKLPLPGA